jgi:thiol:disulfide interchange protein DsbA
MPVAAEERFQESTNYTEIFPPYPGSEVGQIEVVEFFWYSCPHCYDFEPHLKKWLTTKPKDVNFVQVPVIFNPTGRMHAETYYALELMDKLSLVHEAIFSAMHDDRKKLNTAEAMEEFLASKGIDVQAFKQAKASFGVQTKVNRAMDLAKRFNVTGVPNVVVNGSFKTANTKSFEEMIELINYLVDTSRKSGADVATSM